MRAENHITENLRLETAGRYNLQNIPGEFRIVVKIVSLNLNLPPVNQTNYGRR